ncbi:MAG: geranylgeranylglycerol-phosphate geranylgeranyltransferase [Bacteroidia bacterium]|nr:geranylgeranylglycerol-phosphate geranylgeranyltransferase [Bacteroidia bacterium]
MLPQDTQPFTLSALLRLTRFWNLVIIGLAQYCTAWFLLGSHTILDMDLFLLSGSTVLIAAAGYIINDYYDVKIDLINKPDRVVIGKNITRRYAILFHSFLSTSGVGIGFLLDWKIGAINFLSVFFLWLYSNNLKRQPFIGNFVVALLTAISILIINLLYETNNPLISIYALFAFFMTLMREMIKDMEDLRGDNTFGCRTLPVICGLRKSKIFVYATLFLFVVSVLYINHIYIGLPMYYFIIFLFIPLGWLLARLIRADTIKDFYKLSQFCKVIMLLGISSMAFI